MKPNPLPSQQLLLQCLRYDPITGELWWKERSPDTFKGTESRSAERQAKNFNARFANKRAFNSPCKNGYLKGTINGEFFYAHRIIWKMLHNVEPDDIDHDNRIRSDNRELNLVDKSRAGNLQNRKLPSNNTSGHHGVSFSKRHNLWSVSIYKDNKRIHLGWFKDKETAIATRQQAEVSYGYHPNHGK